MKRLLLATTAFLVLQGCVTTDCERLAYETAPESAPPLKYPTDVREPTPSGEFRVPDVKGEQSADCLAYPPDTLPPEARKREEDADEE